MQRIPIIFTLWPGLPQLWLHGRWLGLAKAVGFAALLNFVLIATYVQTDLISKAYLIMAWIACGLIWSSAILLNDADANVSTANELDSEKAEEFDRLFVSAQSEYLQGHLDEAENLFERLIWLRPSDLDARLYLATIFRHRGRIRHANRHLDLIEKFDQVTKWQFQIEDERRLLSELEEELRESKNEENDNFQQLDNDNEIAEVATAEFRRAG